jgi:RecT family.
LQTISEAMKFGQMLAESSFVPKDFRGKPAECVLAVQHGAELGLGPMQSVQSIAVVNGRPSIYGDAAIALAKGSPVCDYISERIEGDGDQMAAVCEAKRRGDPQPTVSTFAVADAKTAGLWGKSGPWQQYPKRMLQMRARGFALRDAFPDVLRGLVTTEEAQDYQHVEPARSEPQPVEDTDPLARARMAVNRAKSIGDCDRIRARAIELAESGEWTEEQAGEIKQLSVHKAEMLISEEAAA